MKILVDKMPEKPNDCLWAHRDAWGYVCYAIGSGDWSMPSCMVYLGGKCPYLKELPEKEEVEDEQ